MNQSPVISSFTGTRYDSTSLSFNNGKSCVAFMTNFIEWRRKISTVKAARPPRYTRSTTLLTFENGNINTNLRSIDKFLSFFIRSKPLLSINRACDLLISSPLSVRINRWAAINIKNFSFALFIP
ncbi:hypothetical protein DERP_005853 [Dermatophagoides pteronyssinus]|uniref:Uncharacterized protein n=1 Tax=Dermatophagoides pteronyssinus TaxID=6956 RepID=A0ABQ8JAC6_DERPT|nr:hypothetical protein DERP_005853 [Dermatophagoides pteronyssinus]